jgi:hypothetical protein
MFVQVIKGRTKDAAGVRAHLDTWAAEVRPGATGLVGGTSGVADDGTVIGIVRFEDQAAAQANSDRPEQGEWWKGMEALLDGEATFRESTDTSALFDGPDQSATFVQIMEGVVPDRAKAEAAESPEMMAQLKQARPDLLGGLRIWFDGGAYVEAAYFTSEDDARKGETSSEFEPTQEEYGAMFGDVTYTDLRNPQHT